MPDRALPLRPEASLLREYGRVTAGGTGLVDPIRPGSGWPGDLADASTPIATTASGVRRLARTAHQLPGHDGLDARVSVCRACPRLVAWRETVAVEKRRSYAGEPYWGRPITGWGATDPSVVIVGLAPAAHGGNRTGRIFTGDRSGDWLFASLYRVGLARIPTSTRPDDGQQLISTRMVAAVRCAPPANKPLPVERDTCAPWIERELTLVAPTVRAVVALGGFAWLAALRTLGAIGYALPSSLPRFGHGVEVAIMAPDGHDVLLIASYHPSQQNTFTGKLTEPMLDAVLGRAAALAPHAAGPQRDRLGRGLQHD